MKAEKTIAVSGIEATLTRKSVKNLRVAVLPPDGAVRVTAPRLLPEAMIRAFLSGKADWIRRTQDRVRAQHANEPKRFETGETAMLFGSVYPLSVTAHRPKNGVTMENGRIVLALRGEADPKRCEALLNEWYRARLGAEIAYLLPLWSEKTGLVPSAWSIRDMTSRWGSCNTQTGRITLNLQLAKYPQTCLEYVILHEFAHLKARGHGPDFKAILDEHMPDWRTRRKRLNG